MKKKKLKIRRKKLTRLEKQVHRLCLAALILGMASALTAEKK